jgi:hypothetical protein
MKSDIFNSELCKEWSSQIESDRAVEIIKLLGYSNPISVTLFGLVLHNVNNKNIYIPAFLCNKLLPSTLKKLIEEGGYR